MGEYIANGASSVVLSDAIFDKEAMAQNNFSTIHQLAHFAALQASQAIERLGFAFIFYFIFLQAILFSFFQNLPWMNLTKIEKIEEVKNDWSKVGVRCFAYISQYLRILKLF